MSTEMGVDGTCHEFMKRTIGRYREAGTEFHRKSLKPRCLKVLMSQVSCFASEALVIALTILCNVLLCNLAEGLAHLDDGVIATRNTHWGHRKIGMASSTVPVSFRGLRIKRADAVMLLSHSQHDVASHGEMVSHLNAAAWANLELPLSRHHLCIDARNLHPSLHAQLVVLIRNRSANGNVETGPSVVGTLRRRLTAVGIEAQGNGGLQANFAWLHQGVLLLNAEPWVQGTVHVHGLCTLGPSVVLGWLVIPCIPGISKDHHMGVATSCWLMRMH